MKRNLRAFTLIELLVVIAIIAILAAILFPVFAQAKMSAKKASDLSNMKQNTLGIIIYSNDYDDYFPEFGYGDFGAGYLDSYIWCSAKCIGPYLKNVDIIRSPDESYSIGDNTGYPTYRAPWKMQSYMPNTVNPDTAWAFPGYTTPKGAIGTGKLFDGWFSTNSSPTSQTEATAVADTILLTSGRPDWEKCGAGWNAWTNQEIMWYPTWTIGIGVWGWDIQALTVTPWTEDCRHAWRRYNGGSNFTFMDGHAKTLRPGDLVTGDNPNPKRWLVNQ